VNDDASIGDWFLGADGRGNPASELDRRRGDGRAFTVGNQVDLLVHGRPYFEQLYRALCETQPGDTVHFADWRGDPDQYLVEGVEFASVLADLAKRGVKVRGLVWRSHPKAAGFHMEHHLELAQKVNDAGGLILLDQRVRPAGSHHQKLVLIHYAGDTEDVAFVGGIDLCHGRRDDERHLGDPQPEELDDAYGVRPPWHDAQVRVRGPALGDLDLVFRERWDDPTPMADHRTPWRALVSKIAKQPDRRDKIPPPPPDPALAGATAIQVLRTYPKKRPPYPFAPDGERSIVRAYQRAFARARRLIYVEDQYMWSREVADLFASALQREPELRVMVIVPRIPDRNGFVSGPPHRIAQLQLVDRLRTVAADRFAIYDLENAVGTPIYVHAKTVVVDDVWAEVGSDNMNRRSWTHDSELSIGVLDSERDQREPTDPAGMGDGARAFARNLRLNLLREHTGLGSDHTLLDPVEAFERVRASADALDAWHRDGKNGPRPPGQLRNHSLPAMRWWESWWARPLYRTILDPDGRPRELKRRIAY
jgi:phosphatidylserine/phosphatidylglycerophosphate/cardiolipin synthase-like enzyme